MFSGNCICGKCQYQVDQKPGYSLLCQCTDCQKISGSGHSALMIVKRSALQLSGPVKTHERSIVSGNSVSNTFCADCGSPLINQSSGYPDVSFLHAGSLQDPSIFDPKTVAHRKSGHVWDLIDPEQI